MKFLDAHLSVSDDCVTDDGSRGRCDGCKKYCLLSSFLFNNFEGLR